MRFSITMVDDYPQSGHGPLTIVVDGTAADLADYERARHETPERVLTIPVARLHAIADPSTATITAGRIAEIREW